MAGSVLTSAQYLVLSEEHSKLMEEKLPGTALILKLSEAALKLSGQEAEGALDTVKKASGMLKDFFGVLRASADLTRGLRLEEVSPPESSEK